MKTRLPAPQPQPFTALVMMALALLCLGEAAMSSVPAPLMAIQPSNLVLAAFLFLAIVTSSRYPIHIRHNIKVILTTVPIYAAAMLLAPFPAGLVVCFGIVISETLSYRDTGNTLSDIVTQTSRWTLIATSGALLAVHFQNLPIPTPLLLAGAALTMLALDLVTGSLEIAPMSRERPWHVFKVLVREATLPEAVQYLISILAVLAAYQQRWSIVLWVLPLAIVYQSFKYVKEMHDGTRQLLESMADIVDVRDPYTGGHSRRVSDIAISILHQIGMYGPEVDLIASAARVHDIGKIGIPDYILNKPQSLTVAEKALMDSHPVRGAELLARYRDFARGMDIVRHHHERWDGGGYPDGLRGVDIPFGARVIAVADSFDAMTSDRPYRNGMPLAEALRILKEGRGTQWDAAVVDAFLACREYTLQPDQAPAERPLGDMQALQAPVPPA